MLKTIIVAFCYTISINVFALEINLNLNRDNTKNIAISSLRSNKTLKIKFNLKKLKITKNNHLLSVGQFEDIKIDSLPNSFEIGAPKLPFYSFMVEGKPDNINLLVNFGKPLLINKEILPTPTKILPVRGGIKNKAYFSLNKNAYISSLEKVKLEYLGDYRGTPITRILIKPVRYQNYKTLNIYSKLEIQLTKKNGEDIKVFNVKSLKNRKSQKLLIATSEKFINSLQAFIEFKKENGFEVKVYNIKEYQKDANKIKSKFKKIFKKWKYDYAILVGEEKYFPTFFRVTSNHPETPTDMPYFTFGLHDNIPDVLYSRIVAQDAFEVEYQLNKIIEYSKTKIIGKMLSIASDEGENPSDEEYVSSMAKTLVNKFHLNNKFIFQKDTSVNSQTITKFLSKGINWVNYIGHGDGFSWDSVDPEVFSINNIKMIAPSGQYPIIIDVACQNGKFVKGHFGERFVNQESSNGLTIGASAYFGGSVNISWNPPAIMAIGITKALEQNDMILGSVLFKGQMYLLNHYDVIQDVYDNFIWYHLFGDSSMTVKLK